MRGAAALALILLAAPAAAEPLPQQPAAEIDPARFTHAAAVTLPPSPAGVTRLRLGPAVLAAARADLADLRVVDAASRQWPYLLRAEVDREEVPLGVTLARGERGASRYLLSLPVAPAAVDVVTLRVDRAYFDRPFRLTGDLPGSGGAEPTRSMPLASGRLSRAAGGPETIDLAFPRRRVTALTLLVEDGDEAPLPVTAARAGLPLAELRVVAPPGAYTLFAGGESEAPRYEIARLRERVLAAEAPLGAVGELLPNPRHRGPTVSDGLEKTALWAVMGLAVVALAALTLRLSRRESEGRESASKTPPTAP